MHEKGDGEWGKTSQLRWTEAPRRYRFFSNNNNALCIA